MSSQSTLRIASAQYPFDRHESLELLEAKVRDWVTEGVRFGAELLVFPEYAAIEIAGCFGDEISRDLQKTLECVADLSERWVQLHVELAQLHDVHILVGSGPLRNGDGSFVNAAHLATPNGRVGFQEKMIMTPFEVEWGVQPGSGLKVFETSLGRIGILICYDSEFPLLARAVVEAGAEILLVPSCTERETGFNRVRIGAQARALEGGVVSVQSATVGEALWSPAVDLNVGAAGVYVPPEHGVSADGLIAKGELNEPGWIVGDVNLETLKDLRFGGEMRNFNDWRAQPGAMELREQVEIVSLL